MSLGLNDDPPQSREERLARDAYLAKAKRYQRWVALGGHTSDEEAVAWSLDVLNHDPCSYCGGRPAGTVDHIVPTRNQNKTWQEDNTVENLAAACRRCNGRKSNRRLLIFLAARMGVWNAMSVPERRRAKQERT